MIGVVFQSYNGLFYNALANLSFDSDYGAMDVSGVAELEHCNTRFARQGCRCEHSVGSCAAEPSL